MSDKKGKKRPKSYYLKCAAGGKKFKRANDLTAGTKGFLVTCNKYEKETVREMYNILNEYADQLYGPEVKPGDQDDGSESDEEEEDMEKAMAKEISTMKKAGTKERRFQNTDTKSKNCIFIRTTVEDPCELAHKIFTDIVEKQVQKARYALRMLPISVTCKASMDKIKETAEAMLKPHFETEFGVGLKYTSVCKIRNNQSVSRIAILPTLGKIIQELNPLHRLCHDQPDLVIIIEIIRNVCCMSVVRDYFNYKKYNFHEVLVKKDATGSESGHCKPENRQDERKIFKDNVLETETGSECTKNEESSTETEAVEAKEIKEEPSTEKETVEAKENNKESSTEKETVEAKENNEEPSTEKETVEVKENNEESSTEKETVEVKENIEESSTEKETVEVRENNEKVESSVVDAVEDTQGDGEKEQTSSEEAVSSDAQTTQENKEGSGTIENNND